MASSLWLRNLTCFHLNELPETTAEQLATALEPARFRGVAKLEKEHSGFTPVFDQERLVLEIDGAYLVQMKTEQKSVPGATLKQMLTEKVLEIEAKEGRKLGRKEKKAQKEVIFEELLAKALPTQSVTTAVLDRTAGYVWVDTSSLKKAERVLELLIHTVTGLEIGLLEFPEEVSGKLADLLLADTYDNFVADSTLVLKGPGSPAATARFSQFNLGQPEVTAHLKNGLRPIALELTWNDRISFMLTDPFSLRRITYLDQVQDEVADLGEEDAEALTAAIMTLQLGELRNLFADLQGWLGFEGAD